MNQPCAFGDVRYLWADGSYTTHPGFPAWGWIGGGGDTYIIDCPTDCRVGFNGPTSSRADSFLGIVGNPYGSGAPAPPNGTATVHTRILGKNFANCTSDDAKAHLNGGYGTSAVFNLKGSSYVDLACFNITDHSSCGRAGQVKACHTGFPLDDYATYGIATSRLTTNVAITDVRIHGMANAGMVGPTGDGVSLKRVALVGNPSSGWNMDAGDGTTGTGTLSLDYVSVLWNGCAEEYPIAHGLPYQDCADDNSGGYGDGVGTASVVSDPAWIFKVDHSVAAYNTQDGFDLLHLQGNGSTLTITNSMAYSNMGQQLKVGAASTSRNNLIVGNCNALRQAIPRTPAGYNSRLSDFCRAADTMAVLAVHDGATTYFQNNTMYSANATAVEIDCGSCSSLATIDYENNIFIGFKNDAGNGYPRGGSGDWANPIYNSAKGLFSNPGSTFSHNATFRPKSNWTCPQASYNETDAVCVDPELKDETWHLYGYGDMSPAANSPVVGKGVAIGGLTSDYRGVFRPSPPSIGALEPGPNPVPNEVQMDITPNPATANDKLLLMASVKPIPGSISPPTGAVMFLDGNTSLGIASLNNAGEDVLDVSRLSIGSHGMMVVYSGDGKNPGWGSGITPLQGNSPTAMPFCR